MLARLEALVEDLLEKTVSLLHNSEEGILLHVGVFYQFFEVLVRGHQLLVEVFQLRLKLV